MYRCLVMGEDSNAGLSVVALVHDDERSLTMRTGVVEHCKEWVKGTKGQHKRQLRTQVKSEMQDDPQWKQPAGWDWEKYFAYAQQQHTFGTYFNIAGYERKSGAGVMVYQYDKDRKLVKVRDAEGIAGKPVIRLLRNRNHFDLLVPAAKQDVEEPRPVAAPAKGKKRVADEEKGKPNKKQRKEEPTKKRKANEQVMDKQEDDPKKKKKQSNTKRKTLEEKEEAALQKRLAAEAAFGRCRHEKCRAPLKIIAPAPGMKYPRVGCPRWRSGCCQGYVRYLDPSEDDKLPRKLIRRAPRR